MSAPPIKVLRCDCGVCIAEDGDTHFWRCRICGLESFEAQGLAEAADAGRAHLAAHHEQQMTS